jgi:hypothetical protein
VQFGFTELHVHRIWAWCIADNAASTRVLERLGMQLEGLARKRTLQRPLVGHVSVRHPRRRLERLTTATTWLAAASFKYPVQAGLNAQIDFFAAFTYNSLGVGRSGRQSESTMANNPFTYGNPISDPRRFVGREHEIELIFSRLRNAEFESSSLVGERRIGKTSLLNYLSDRDVRRRYDLLSGAHMFVYVDLQIMNQDVTPVRLWQHWLRQMGRVCQDPTVHQAIDEIRQQDAIDNFALADLFDIIDEKNQYVVFLLDEFEKVTENPNFGTDFFYGLRSLAIQHHLALVTSSRRELIELCHSEAIRSSPFFNIFPTSTSARFRPMKLAADRYLAGRNRGQVLRGYRR